VLVLYDAARCPYCARVRIVLAEKGIAYESVEIDLADRPAWLLAKNPSGRVPVLEEDGGLDLPESHVIMEYLDERYPEPPLLPADPADRALARLRLDRFDDLAAPYYAVRSGNEEARPSLDAELAKLDAALQGSPYLTGAAFGLVDVGYVPWILRARANLGVELEGHPALADWVERLEDRPAIAAESELAAALA
jgi:glutathione S-transferase